MNALWNLWLNASIIEAYNVAFSPLGLPIFIIGVTDGNEQDLIDNAVAGMISIDIETDMEQMASTEYKFSAKILVLVTSVIAQDRFAHFRNEGAVIAAIPKCITVYQRGTSDATVFGQMRWDGQLKPVRYPSSGSNSRQAQSLYELNYIGEF